MMKGFPYLVTVAILALAFSLASAYDPSPLHSDDSKKFSQGVLGSGCSWEHPDINVGSPLPLQDFCVAINNTNSAVFVNGKFCKDLAVVIANDFFFPGLNIPASTANKVRFNVILVNVNLLPGLNTLGISLARLDFAPYGLDPPHIHPRASEILVVAEGTLLVGFVTSNPNKLFTKVLNKGDVSAFPIGLIHFQFYVGQTNVVAFAGLNSQNPRMITIANTIFGSNPPINPDILIKAFQVDKNVIDYLQKQFELNHNLEKYM